MSFAPNIAMVVDNHSLLAIRTSDVVERNISAYLLDNEISDDYGRVAVYHLPLQGVDVDNLDPPLHRIEMGAAQSDDWLPRRPRHLCLACRRGCSHVDVG